MYSDSEDEVFFGPLTMREIKIGFGVIDKKNMSTSKNNERHKMESNRNSIIEISSEENSFADLDDKENTNPIPSMKNISISNNFENAIKDSKLEDTFKSKFNECSNSTVSTNSDDTKSISSSFLDKLVACISEGNENLFDNIHPVGKRNVQASPCLSRIEEIQSFNTNHSNTDNKDNETYDLIIDLSDSKSEISKNTDNVHFISSINNSDSKADENNSNEIISETNNDSRNFISSINNDEEFSEKLYDCISSIHNDGGISEKYENCISSIHNDEAVSEKYENCVISINNDEAVSEKYASCISPINNVEIVSEKCISPINNDEMVSEKCISPINNDEIVSDIFSPTINIDEMVSQKCISPINKDEIDTKECISSINNDEIVSEKCISPINNDEMVSEKCISPMHNDEIVSEICTSPINNDEMVAGKCISPINNDEIVSEKCISPINIDEMVSEKISPINNVEIVSEKCISPKISEINTEIVTENHENCNLSINNDAVIMEKSENCNLSNNNGKIISENLKTDNKLEYLENVSYEDDFEDIDSNYSSKIEDINEIEISKILDEDDSLNEINNTFSECTLNSTNENQENGKNTEILGPNKENDEGKDEHESGNKLYAGYSELKMYNRIEAVDKIENIFFENRPESESNSEDSEDKNDNPRLYNIETNDTLDKFLENKIQNENDSLLSESNTSSLGCEEINSSVEEPNRFPSLNRKLDSIEHVNPKPNRENINDNWKEANSPIRESKQVLLLNQKLPTSPIEHVHLKNRQNDIDNHWKQPGSPIGKLEKVQSINRKFSTSSIEHIHPKPLNSPIGDSKEVQSINRKFSTSPIGHVHRKPHNSPVGESKEVQSINRKFSTSPIGHVHRKPHNSSIGESKEVQSINRKFSTSPIGHVHRKPHNSSIGELKEIQLANRKFSTSPIQHVHKKPTQANSPIGVSKDGQSVNQSPIEHVHLKPHRQSEIIENNWKQALALSNDTLIAEQSMLPTSITLLEKTSIDYNLNSTENNKVFKPSTIPTILEKSEQSIDLTCSENESMLSESHINESYSTACEDSEAECNNTLDMIDRLLKMEAASNATSVQSTEKPKQVEHVSPRKPKLDPSTNSNIRTLSRLQTPKAVAKPLEKIKPIINSPLKTTPKKPISSTPSRLGLQNGNVINKIQQSKVSPLVKNAPSLRKGFVARTPSSAAKNVPTKTNVNSPKMISPIIKSSKEPISKPSRTVPTRINVNSPKLISPLVKNTKAAPSSATKTTSVDSPITAEVNELTESFDHGKAESSFVQLRSTLRRQLSDLYIEPSSTEKRATPKPKIAPSIEVKKNVFKTPTVTRVLKSTEKSKMPKNIMSPVDFYINKAPQSPLVVKCDYSKRQTKFYDKEKVKNGENNEVESIENPLPFCAYKSASNVKLFEDKTTEVPKSVRKFFPTVQYVIKHESRIKTEERKSPRLRPQTTMNNDSLNALDNSLSIFNASANANDVSVRVKKSALRTPK